MRSSAEPPPATWHDDRGFTLIEMLIVMIILGILVGVAVPTMLAQKHKAQDSAAKADALNIALQATSVRVDSGVTAMTLTQSGRTWTVVATRASGTEQVTGQLSESDTASMTYTASNDQFCVTVQSASGRYFSAGDSGGVVSGAACP